MPKKAQQKNMERFAVARIRMECSHYKIVQAHTETHGESVNAFINRAIEETMARDNTNASKMLDAEIRLGKEDTDK